MDAVRTGQGSFKLNILTTDGVWWDRQELLKGVVMILGKFSCCPFCVFPYPFLCPLLSGIALLACLLAYLSIWLYT